MGPPPLTVNFSDESKGELENWEWDFGDGSSSTEQNPTHVYEVNGVYTVSLTVVDTAGQTETMTKADFVTVTNSTGVQIKSESKVFSVYPNPTAQSIILDFHPENPIEAELAAYNTLGQKVKFLYEGTLSKDNGNLTFDISDLKEGYLLYQIVSQNL